MKKNILLCALILCIMAGCTSKYLVTFSRNENQELFIRNIDSFLRSKGYIPDSDSNDFDRDRFTRMKRNYPEFIDVWRLSFRAADLFQSWQHIFMFLWKDGDDYLLEIIPGNSTDSNVLYENVGLIKSWLQTEYPMLEVDIKTESFVDFR